MFARQSVQVLILALLIGLPNLVLSDQTDPRLDELFVILQNSQDEMKLVEVEAEIWEIWYESGHAEVDSPRLVRSS